MRTGKYVASGNKTTACRYDGRMGIEDVETSPGTTTVTDYAIGARGIDGVSTNTNGTGATVSYPIYDAHGNNVLTLTKSGTNYYSTGSLRSYDAWGGVRIGNPNGDPHGQYCASLGHKADDETGFIYMRARYYEPSTGRWLSEDPAGHGLNFYAYCSNNPIGRRDTNGKEDSFSDVLNFVGNFVNIVGQLMMGGLALNKEYLTDLARDKAAGAVLWITKHCKLLSEEDQVWVEQVCQIVKLAAAMCSAADSALSLTVGGAVERVIGYEMMLMGQMMMTDAVIANPTGGGTWWSYGDPLPGM